MKTKSCIVRAALASTSLFLIAACETPPTVVTQTTTTTETTAVTQGDRIVAPPVTVVHPSRVKTTTYHVD